MLVEGALCRNHRHELERGPLVTGTLNLKPCTCGYEETPDSEEMDPHEVRDKILNVDIRIPQLDPKEYRHVLPGEEDAEGDSS